MADSFRLIIDSGTHGLPHAPGFYADNPREPSPEGTMTLSAKTTVSLPQMTFSGVLDEMAKVAEGGTVMLICHGSGTTGFLVRLDSSANAKQASVAALKVISDLEAPEAEAAKIRAMPQKSDAEKAAKVAAWTALVNRLQPNAISGTVTVVEAERQYEAIITMRAGNLGITAQSLRSLIRKMQKVRERKLKRVEVRACGVGAQEALMKSLKAFFGCGKFLAPKAETFYLPKTSVDVIASGSGAPAFKGWEPDPRFRVRDPGIRVGNPIVEMRKLSGGKQRVFTVNGKPAFTLRIWELYPFVYTALGAAPSPAGASPARGQSPAPDWNLVRDFIRAFISPASTHKSGAFRIAGFWDTSSASLPFVLPNEKEYVNLIKSV
jgi:hypothetical protein